MSLLRDALRRLQDAVVVGSLKQTWVQKVKRLLSL